jgi:hypothetical protein
MSDQPPHETARLTLSPLEGQRLFGFLTGLAEHGELETGFSGLDDFLDILDDANALAIWLRENVNIELEGPEAAKAMAALESMLAEKGFPQGPDVVPSGIQDQPTQCIPGWNCAADAI